MHHLNVNTAINCTNDCTIELTSDCFITLFIDKNQPFKVQLFKLPQSRLRFSLYDTNREKWTSYDSDSLYMGTGDIVRLGTISILLTYIDPVSQTANLSFYSKQDHILREMESRISRAKSENNHTHIPSLAELNTPQYFNLKNVKTSLKIKNKDLIHAI